LDKAAVRHFSVKNFICIEIIQTPYIYGVTGFDSWLLRKDAWSNEPFKTSMLQPRRDSKHCDKKDGKDNDLDD